MVPSWLGFLAAIGLGSIVAAMIARGVAIAQLRQAWINSLRDELADIFASSDRVSVLVRDVGGPDTQTQLTEQSHISTAIYRKVLMRLNVGDPLHADLQAKLEALNHVGGRDAYIAKIDSAVLAARRVLKVEWEVTKFGPLTYFFSNPDYFRAPDPAPPESQL